MLHVHVCCTAGTREQGSQWQSCFKDTMHCALLCLMDHDQNVTTPKTLELCRNRKLLSLHGTSVSSLRRCLEVEDLGSWNASDEELRFLGGTKGWRRRSHAHSIVARVKCCAGSNVISGSSTYIWQKINTAKVKEIPRLISSFVHPDFCPRCVAEAATARCKDMQTLQAWMEHVKEGWPFQIASCLAVTRHSWLRRGLVLLLCLPLATTCNAHVTSRVLFSLVILFKWWTGKLTNTHRRQSRYTYYWSITFFKLVQSNPINLYFKDVFHRVLKNKIAR